LAAAARGGALAVGELFDGQRPEPGAAREAAPDFPLTGASGEEVLSALRARADAALIEKDVREGKPTPAPGSTGRPEGWALRVDNWILGQQALVREPLTRWMAERSFVSRALGGTPLDVETFLVALAKVNAALDGLAPPIQAADLFVLGEAGLDEPRPDGPDLRAVGALHPGGRVHVLASFAQTLTPEELAAAVLREHLVLRGFPYGSAVKAMQAVTRKAFGRPVLAVDLRTAARLSLAGPREDGSPRWRPEAPFAPAPQEEPGWMRWHRAISVGLLVLAAATAIPLLAFWAASGRWAFAAVGLAAFLALGGGLFAAARRAGDWLEERWNRNAPARLLGGVEYRFDPASLRLVERNDGVDEGRDFRYAALIFEDARGWRVAVIPHAATTEGADDALEVQWGFQGLDDSSRGYFFILAPEELAGHPEAAGHLVTARDFDRDLLAAFERAANRYLRAPGRTSDERRAVRGLMRSFVRGLKGREGGRDGDEPDLQAA
jgi:hypothetical protein